MTPEQAAFEQHGSKAEAARALGIPVTTFKDRLARATAGEFNLPPGHVIKGISALLDQEGKVKAQWVKTREGEASLPEIVEAVKEAFADYEGPVINRLSPPQSNADLLTLYPLSDLHVGLYAWSKEVGENLDLKIAEDKITAALSELVKNEGDSETAVVLGGGDLTHADNQENRTARSGNNLDVDGRYAKVVGVACRTIVSTVDLALARHNKVIVRILPGNHDEHTSVAAAYHTAAWFRSEPRVTVDLDPSLYWWHRFGRVLLGATHGHTVKIEKMPAIMAHRRAEDWGASRFRYVHGFHLHRTEKFVTEGEGVVSEIHQAPIPKDAWSYGAGYLSGRSLQAITYHKEFGEVGRSRVAILDGNV